eukprot:1789530-Ditylum_brightwellii.AAC.1
MGGTTNEGCGLLGLQENASGTVVKVGGFCGLAGSSKFVAQWSLTTNALLATLCPPLLIRTKILCLMLCSLHAATRTLLNIVSEERTS